ncbi:MAG: alpha-ketoacid dehydrogenase subunit beta [Alphaproteobacteria bacterium]|nr:alpha-ketoacid dehydrogenase subunit beta [Alphaproteobacteria bacterium]
MTTITFRDAVRAALVEEMERDARVFLIGENLNGRGAAATVTKGLGERFPGRVRETPIVEAGLTGVAVGAAIAGMRPVAELMFSDFATCAMDEIVNQAAKARYMTGGQVGVPLVVRIPTGLQRYLGAQHTQTFESWFMRVPGLHVVVPSSPESAKGLLKTAIRCPDPVIYFEYKSLYDLKGEVRDGEHLIPLGVAEVLRRGKDATVIAIGALVQKALAAAATLAADGIEITVVDPRSLSPLDVATLTEAAAGTGRVVIAEEESVFGGAGGEIAAQLGVACFGRLKAPIRRVGARHIPMPYSKPLADLAFPAADWIEREVRALLRS